MSELDLSVVVPVYNNAATLDEVIDRLLRVLDPMPLSFELIFVDDGSRDRSLDILKAAAAATLSAITATWEAIKAAAAAVWAAITSAAQAAWTAITTAVQLFVAAIIARWLASRWRRLMFAETMYAGISPASPLYSSTFGSTPASSHARHRFRPSMIWPA